MNDSLLPAVELDPAAPAQASVIWLHGLGADGHDFEPIVPELGLPASTPVRFVFPHAPMRPVTINGGAVMRAWYDIKTLDLERHVDIEDLEESRRHLETWIAHERRLGIPSERIVLAGFSQGGAIVLFTGLQLEAPLGGVLALSCYHPVSELIETRSAEANRGAPVFMGHGTFDPVVPIGLAEATVAKLRACGYDVEWHTYPMPHSVCPEEITDIGRWLRRVLVEAG